MGDSERDQRNRANDDYRRGAGNAPANSSVKSTTKGGDTMQSYLGFEAADVATEAQTWTLILGPILLLILGIAVASWLFSKAAGAIRG